MFKSRWSCSTLAGNHRARRLVEIVWKSHSSFGKNIFITSLRDAINLLSTLFILPSGKIFVRNKEFFRNKIFIYKNISQSLYSTIINRISIHGINMSVLHHSRISERTVFLTFIKVCRYFLNCTFYIKFRASAIFYLKRESLRHNSVEFHPVLHSFNLVSND